MRIVVTRPSNCHFKSVLPIVQKGELVDRRPFGDHRSQQNHHQRLTVVATALTLLILSEINFSKYDQLKKYDQNPEDSKDMKKTTFASI